MKYNILLGFEEPTFEKAVVKYLKSLGHEVETFVKLSKMSTRDFVNANPRINTVLLVEQINGIRASSVSQYTAEEMAMLTDERDVNVVAILEPNRKGTAYMQTLYNAGITSALFQKGKKHGVSAKEVCQMIVSRRTRREAREYYGLQDCVCDIEFLGNDTFMLHYSNLFSESKGKNLIERFVNVCSDMTKRQVADFIRRIPEELLNDLKQYEEFHLIVEALVECGVKTAPCRIKDTIVGNVDEKALTYLFQHVLPQASLQHALECLKERKECLEKLESMRKRRSESKFRMPAFLERKNKNAKVETKKEADTVVVEENTGKQGNGLVLPRFILMGTGTLACALVISGVVIIFMC